MVTRRQWIAAVRGPDYPTKMRVVRATLLCLPVTVDGRITVTDDEIAVATGLPRRTVQWHLWKAAEARWITRTDVKRGGNGRRCRFVVSIPVRQNLRTPTATSAQCNRHSDDAGVRNLVAHLNKKSANAREHEAVNDTRDGDDPGRTLRVVPDDEHQERSEGCSPITVALAALSPWARLAYAPITNTARTAS